MQFSISPGHPDFQNIKDSIQDKRIIFPEFESMTKEQKEKEDPSRLEFCQGANEYVQIEISREIEERERDHPLCISDMHKLYDDLITKKIMEPNQIPFLEVESYTKEEEDKWDEAWLITLKGANDYAWLLMEEARLAKEGNKAEENEKEFPRTP